MLPLDEICCLLHERGGSVTFRTKPYQPLGSALIQHILEPPICPYEKICAFRRNYGRCVTGEEMQAKYHKEQ